MKLVISKDKIIHMKNIKLITVALSALALVSLSGCASTPETIPTPSKEPMDQTAFVNQDGICGNLSDIFENSIERMKEKGLVETYKYNDVTFTSVYVPGSTLDGYVGVRYDNVSDGYYKIPSLENYSVVNKFEELTADGSNCVNDSDTEATVTTENNISTTLTINKKDNVLTGFSSMNSENIVTEYSLFYITDDRSKEIISQPAMD